MSYQGQSLGGVLPLRIDAVGVFCSPKSVKVNIIVRLVFERVHYDVTVQHVRHYAIGTQEDSNV